MATMEFLFMRICQRKVFQPSLPENVYRLKNKIGEDIIDIMKIRKRGEREKAI
jgi:hypothetical protein